MSLIDYSFLPRECNIIVLNSGGPDSALMIYKLAQFMLANKNTHNIKAYHITANTPLKNLYGHFAQQVINTINDKLGVDICEEHIIYDTEVNEVHDEKGRPIIQGYGSSMQEVAQNLYKTKNCTYAISGFTMHFPSEEYSDKEMEMRRNTKRCPEYSQGREPFINDPLFNELVWYFPLGKTTKHSVRNEYDDFALEHLFPITRSCESYPGHPNYVEMGHCGKCLHCTERKIAFGKL